MGCFSTYLESFWAIQRWIITLFMSNRSINSSKLFLGTVSQCFKVYILQTILSKHHHAISCFFFVQGGSRPKRTIFRVFWVLGCDGVELIFLKNTTPNLAAIGRQWPRGHSVPMRVKNNDKIKTHIIFSIISTLFLSYQPFLWWSL